MKNKGTEAFASLSTAVMHPFSMYTWAWITSKRRSITRENK